MNIQTVLNGIAPYTVDRSYAEFGKVMENAYTELSFWGSRRVYSVGYKGSITLEDTIQKMNDLIDSHPHFSEEERKTGKAIQTKISILFDISSHQEDKAGYITEFFMIVLSLFTPKQDQLFDKWLSARSYDLYTLQQYRQTFNSSPEGDVCEYIVNKTLRKGSLCFQLHCNQTKIK